MFVFEIIRHFIPIIKRESQLPVLYAPLFHGWSCLLDPYGLFDPSCVFVTLSYIGKTGRTFGTRPEEHKKEVENITTRQFTRQQKRESAAVGHKSAIIDYADRNNCIID